MNEKPFPSDVSIFRRPLLIRQLDNRLSLWRVENPKFHEKPIYHVKEKNELKLIVNLDFPDSFALSWGTDISIDSFLKHASWLIDKLAEQKRMYRPMETGNPIALSVTPVSELTEKRIVKKVLGLDPSYSYFGYNNVTILPLTHEIKFDELCWPLQISDIIEEASKKQGTPIEVPTNPDEVMIRVNAEFCTLILNSFDRGLHRPVAYWSHIAAIDHVHKMYKETALSPIPENLFKTVVRELIPLRFQENINQQSGN